MVEPKTPHASLTQPHAAIVPPPFRGERGAAHDVHDLEPIETILPRVFAEITATYMAGEPAEHRDDYIDQLAEAQAEVEAA